MFISRHIFSFICVYFLSVLAICAQEEFKPDMRFVYHLHGQTRKFDVQISRKDGNLVLSWGIMRNQKYWRGAYIHSEKAVAESRHLCYDQPVDHQVLRLEDSLFGMVSRRVLGEIRSGSAVIDGVTYRMVDRKPNASGHDLIHVIDDAEGAEMWIVDDENLPLIWSMRNNPVEIDWDIQLK